MAKLRIPAAILVLLACLADLPPVRAQANPPGAPPAPPSDAKLDARVRGLFPARARIRASLDLHLTPRGETLIIYEQSDKDTGETAAALALVRESKRIPFSGQQVEDMILDCRFGTAQVFALGPERPALALALVCSPDGSLSNFMILRAGEDSGYAWEFLEGFHAQLRIAPGNPTKMELWSASGGCGDFKQPQVTCSACPQRYSIRKYEWNKRQLEEKKKGENLTKECLDPRQMGRIPIVMTSAPGR